MNKPFPVEVQPPQHVREYVAMVLEGEFSQEELRFVVYNDVQGHEWLPAGSDVPVDDIERILREHDLVYGFRRESNLLVRRVQRWLDALAKKDKTDADQIR